MHVEVERDRFYESESPFRMKTFGNKFYPQILDKFPYKNDRCKFMCVSRDNNLEYECILNLYYEGGS
jgi:hypothetical protein